MRSVSRGRFVGIVLSLTSLIVHHRCYTWITIQPPTHLYPYPIPPCPYNCSKPHSPQTCPQTTPSQRQIVTVEMQRSRSHRTLLPKSCAGSCHERCMICTPGVRSDRCCSSPAYRVSTALLCLLMSVVRGGVPLGFLGREVMQAICFRALPYVRLP